MKRVIAISILLFSFLGVFSNNDQQQPNTHQDSTTSVVTSESVDSKALNNTKDNYVYSDSNQTQHDNTIKILAVLVSIIAGIVGILTLIRFFQKDYNEDKVNTLNNTINDLQAKICEFDNSIKEQQNIIAGQIQILQRNNELLYISLKDIAGENKSQNLLNTITHNYYIFNLYSSCLSSEIGIPLSMNYFDLFAFLEEKGTENDIPDLQFFTKNCGNDDLKSRADNVIGAIRERAKNHRKNKRSND